MKIILASQSKSRKSLMDMAGFDYEIIVSKFDEKVNKSLPLEQQSEELAYGKAKNVFENTQGNRCIIGSDSLIIIDDVQYGKPKDRDDAIRMLKIIQGRSHTVYTGVAIILEKNGQVKEYKTVDKSELYIKEMSDSEIEEYVENEYPYDKAGGYSVRNSFCRFIEKVEGSPFTIEGLPLHIVYQFLKENEII